MNAKPLSTGKMIGLGFFAVVIVFLIWGMVAYNSFVSREENVKTAQSDVEVQYQRRFDLIPNLVNSVQGIFNQEKAIFTALAEARSRYAGAQPGSPEKVQAINEVEGSLGRLLVVMENYPQLRSSEAVLKLQDQLEGTENRISVERNKYNAVVNALNKKVRSFPSNIVAKLFGFEERERFAVTQVAAKEAPTVKLEVK